jgi:hypothetical protein
MLQCDDQNAISQSHIAPQERSPALGSAGQSKLRYFTISAPTLQMAAS